MIMRNKGLVNEINPLADDLGVVVNLLKLSAGKSRDFKAYDLETAFLLLTGKVTFKVGTDVYSASRSDLFSETPCCLHVSCLTKVDIKVELDCEILMIQAANNKVFEPVYYDENLIITEMFGEGPLAATTKRKVATIFDYGSAPYSKLVIGEIVNQPGIWSSYPPHHHPQPELYFYKFDKEGGFGTCYIGEECYKVTNNDLAMIPGGLTHPQNAAPGYMMFYVWIIPHLENDPWLKTRIFDEEHTWVLDPKVKIRQLGDCDDYCFTNNFNRLTIGSNKWVGMANRQKDKALVVPLSVADMEYCSAPEIVAALKGRVETGLWGYTGPNPEFIEAVSNWVYKRHQMKIEKEWLMQFPSVVSAIASIIRSESQVGDGVLIQTPVYHPFRQVVEANGRVIVENPLLNNNEVYTIDFADLEVKLQQARIFIMCSPHNPIGRVWSKEELVKVAELCAKYGVLMLADEIHFDLIMPGYKHTCFGQVSVDDHWIMTISASKGFSLAGLGLCNLIIKDQSLKARIANQQGVDTQRVHTSFGYLATEVAYTKAEKWLDQVILEIEGNYQYLKTVIAEYFPDVTIAPLEGTYLAWLNFNCLKMSNLELETFMIEDAQLYLDEGYIFGEAGSGYERINIACPRDVLEAALGRLVQAAKLKGLIK